MTVLAVGDNIFTTTGAQSVTAPSDGTITIECQGGGGSGNGHGGGGGAAAVTTTIAVTAGQTIWLNVPAGGAASANGGDAWVNTSANAAPSSTAQGCLAKGGSFATTTTGGTGGQASSCIGNTAFNGGNGL